MVEELLGRWAIGGQGSAHWHLAVAPYFNWRDIFRKRAEHRAYLARYARQDVGRLLLMPLPEVAALVLEVSKIVGDENEPRVET